MAILRRFSDHTIQENNIVQTIASAALYFLNALKAISVDISGVVYAGIVVAFGGKADPLAIMPEGFAGIAPWVGVVLFVGTLWYLYRGARQESTRD